MYYPCNKTKALISFAELICVFVFAYAKSWFSHEEAHMKQCVTDFLWGFMGPLSSVILWQSNDVIRIYLDEE